MLFLWACCVCSLLLTSLFFFPSSFLQEGMSRENGGYRSADDMVSFNLCTSLLNLNLVYPNVSGCHKKGDCGGHLTGVEKAPSATQRSGGPRTHGHHEMMIVGFSTAPLTLLPLLPLLHDMINGFQSGVAFFRPVLLPQSARRFCPTSRFCHQYCHRFKMTACCPLFPFYHPIGPFGRWVERPCSQHESPLGKAASE